MLRATYLYGPLLLAGCWLVSLPLRAQQAPSQPRAVYTYVTQPPHLPTSTSQTDLLQAAQQAVVYPPRAKEQGVAGKVIIKLILDPEGLIHDANVARSLRPDCDSAALAAVRRLPKLIPARLNGRAVYYTFSLPISFPPASASAPQR